MKQNIKVMTFNLRVAVSSDPFVWEERKHWAAKIIEDHKPDLLGTQEATVPMLEWLKERFHETYDVYGVNRSAQDAGEFSAIFVKRELFSIIRKNSFMLSETPDVIGSMGWDARCARICSWTELSYKNDTRPVLRFFNTHLDHMGEVARKEGLRLILNQIQEENRVMRLPVILTGDFNATPESGLFKEMDGFAPMTSCFDLFTEEEKKNSKTIHGYKGGMEGSPIDYIFCSEEIDWLSTVIVRDQFGQGYPSDHYPVVSTVNV